VLARARIVVPIAVIVRGRGQRLQAGERRIRGDCFRAPGRVRQRFQLREPAVLCGHGARARQRSRQRRHLPAGQIPQCLVVRIAMPARGYLGACARDELGHGRSGHPRCSGARDPIALSGRAFLTGMVGAGSRRRRLRRGLFFGCHGYTATARDAGADQYPARLSALSI